MNWQLGIHLPCPSLYCFHFVSVHRSHIIIILIQLLDYKVCNFSSYYTVYTNYSNTTQNKCE